MSAIENPRLIVALDFACAKDAIEFSKQIDPQQCRLKVGKELFTASGPQLIEQLMLQNFAIFLDLKFHDIPNTVAGACRAAAQLGVWMINVHASGGLNMLQAARAAIDAATTKPLLTAVTVLTSSDANTLREVGVQNSVADQVVKLAQLSQQAGLDGVVCSGHEIQLLRQKITREFCLVVPGIRLQAAENDDQKRVMTPAQAIALGADYLVVGRPITQAKNPQKVIDAMQVDIANSAMS